MIRRVRSSVPVRSVNVLLGAWLFASAFLWPHQDNARFNDWVCGMLVAASALSAIWAPALRWTSTGLAVWLGFGALFFDYSSQATRLHDLAIAGIVFAVSLVRAELPRAQPGEAG